MRVWAKFFTASPHLTHFHSSKSNAKISKFVKKFCTEMPIKILNVAEKNDAAKNIAELLSRGSSRRVTIETMFTFKINFF